MQHTPQKASPLKSYSILIFLSLVWGSSFILIKKALIAFDPVEVACMRISISAIAFTPFLLWQFRNVDWKKWKYFLLVGLGDSGGDSSNQWYGLYVVIGTFCYGFSSNIVQHNLTGIRSLIISAVSFCLIGPPALAYLATTDFMTDITTHEYGYQSLAAITFLALIGTVMASILFYYLVQVTDAVFSSTVAFIMPLVAILWGIFDGEIFLMTDLIGMMLILGGVYLIKRKK